MTAANILQAGPYAMPLALKRAQAAIHLPQVQAMLRKLSEYDLGIFMPHQHDGTTGDFQPLQHDFTQVESGCRVSFQRTDAIAGQADRYLPVAWLWRSGASTPASVCEMDLQEGAGAAERSVKHQMPVDD